MQLYPIFMDLSASRCLIVGAGGVGVRKLESLLRARPLEILVVDPSPAPVCLQLATHPRVVLAKRMFMPDDCNDRTLVFAATGSREVNAAVAACCAKRGILCNIADNKEESSFIVPACIEHKNLSLAISTHGGSPALSRRWFLPCTARQGKIQTSFEAWFIRLSLKRCNSGTEISVRRF